MLVVTHSQLEESVKLLLVHFLLLINVSMPLSFSLVRCKVLFRRCYTLSMEFLYALTHGVLSLLYPALSLVSFISHTHTTHVSFTLHASLTHTHTHSYTLIHTYTHLYTHTHTHSHTLIHTHTHSHTLTHTHTHSHTLIHTHAHLLTLTTGADVVSWLMKNLSIQTKGKHFQYALE